MKKRGPNDEEMMVAVLTGLPTEELAKMLEADGVIATDVGKDDLDGLVENSEQLRRELGLPTRRK